MIHEVGRELATKLKALGVPHEVVTGPEPTTTTTFARERIVIEQTGRDKFTHARSQHKNPDVRFICLQACRITIYAQSPRSGAQLFEHRRRANAVRDLVMCALEEVALTRKNGIAFGDGGFITPTDLAATELAQGAVYELSFTFERGVGKRKFTTGEVNTVKTIGPGGVSITSTTKLSLQGAPDDDDDPHNIPAAAETACGGED